MEKTWIKTPSRKRPLEDPTASTTPTQKTKTDFIPQDRRLEKTPSKKKPTRDLITIFEKKCDH